MTKYIMEAFPKFSVNIRFDSQNNGYDEHFSFLLP